MAPSPSQPPQPPRFTDNPAIAGRPQNFTTVTVDLAPVLGSWRESLFAHEWLNRNGSVKKPDEQSAEVRARRESVTQALAGGGTLERPVLGIGILDNVEIGAGRDVLLTLAALGYSQISVHIPRGNLDEFAGFIKDAEEGAPS